MDVILLSLSSLYSEDDTLKLSHYINEEIQSDLIEHH